MGSASPVWSSPPRSNCSISAGLSPQHVAITHSPRGRQSFKITTPISAEVPQDFLASSEAEDAAVATTNGISLAPDNLEEVAHLMAQELPYPVFDTDTEVVASMLNAKLEFDEALLTENVALNCAAQGGRGEVEGIVQNAEMEVDNQENNSEDEDTSHYIRFSRTVVCDAASSSDASGQLPSAKSISQLDGADSGSESDESEAVDDEAQDAGGEHRGIKIHNNPDTSTKQLTVELKRLKSIHCVPQSIFEQELHQDCPPSDVLHSSFVNDDMLLQEEEVQISSESPTSQNEQFLDSATRHFVSGEDGALLYPSKNDSDDKDGNISSDDSLETFKDDLNDPDYAPEFTNKKPPTTMMKRIVINKAKRAASNLKYMQTKLCLQPQNKPNLQLQPQSTQTVNIASASAASSNFSSVPRTVTSPIVLNGLNALPIQPGATRGRAIAIRLDTVRPGIQQQVVIHNQGTSGTPTPQVLLVNRQGQILIKDPRTNTYQAVSTNSPAYNKISQIAKILHSGNALQRSVPRVIIKPQCSRSSPNVPPVANHATQEKKVIVRLVPVKSSSTSVSAVPASVQSVPEPSFAKMQESTVQAVIDRTMAANQNVQKSVPIILRTTQRPKAQSLEPFKFQEREDSELSPPACSESPTGFLDESDFDPHQSLGSSRQQVRVKRVSSVSDRPTRKKSKMDFLMDPSNEQDDINDTRYHVSYFLYIVHKICLIWGYFYM